MLFGLIFQHVQSADSYRLQGWWRLDIVILSSLLIPVQ